MLQAWRSLPAGAHVAALSHLGLVLQTKAALQIVQIPKLNPSPKSLNLK